MPDESQDGWAMAEAGGQRVAVDPALGNIRLLRFEQGARVIEPLHTAPWLDEGDDSLPPDLIPIERKLAGDFFCAPFGANDMAPAPAHGWSANCPWDVTEGRADTLRLTLRRQVFGAQIAKTLLIAADAPLLYQTHEISGGEGGLTVAHHPMVHLAGLGRFSCSPKRAILTSDTVLEPGRNCLQPGARATRLGAVPGAGGGTLDLTHLPIGEAHEDFVTLVEAAGNLLGWSAILRQAEDDVVFFLKAPHVLPITMLWYSNGGRDYAPWSGRHLGVLGVEDGCTAGAAGHAAALGPNAVSDEGVPTALHLSNDRTHRIAHVIGAIPRPAGWQAVTDIRLDGPTLILEGDGGAPVTLPFAADFFSETV